MGVGAVGEKKKTTITERGPSERHLLVCKPCGG